MSTGAAGSGHHMAGRPPVCARNTPSLQGQRPAGRRRSCAANAASPFLLYRPAASSLPVRWVLVRDPTGELTPAAFLSTGLALSPEHIVAHFLRRWSVEVTFEEVRTHLGMETQRQRSELAIARTTPALLGLFSLVTLLAHQLTASDPFPVRRTAWYHKPLPGRGSPLLVDGVEKCGLPFDAGTHYFASLHAPGLSGLPVLFNLTTIDQPDRVEQ
jgi:hypothetical protein